MRILGIDPGYAILGYGVVEMTGNRFKVIDYGAVTTDAGMEMPDRLKILYNSLMEIIMRHEPEVASVEELFFNTNAKTAILVGQGPCWLARTQGWRLQNTLRSRSNRLWWAMAAQRKSKYRLWSKPY